MERSARTQMYLDLARISLAIEENKSSTKRLSLAVIENPDSILIDAGRQKLDELSIERKKLYSKEISLMMTLSGFNNAKPIGTLEVLANGKVVAHE